MIILAVETSSNNCSTSISKDGKLLSELNFDYEKQHSVILMPMIEKMLSILNISPSEIDAYSINLGPGSFTGLRIGLSVIKAMAFAQNKTIYSYDSFLTLAENVKYHNGEILVVIDALRKTYYSQVLKYNKDNHSFDILVEAKVRNFDEINELCKDFSNLLVVGDALIKNREEFSKIKNSVLASSFESTPKSSSLLSLTLREIESRIIREEYACNPIYMRKSQAEREYDLKMGIKED